jgi:coenzyme F420-0:L-glutamate ligase / coenzyme F420-1:gamma-L-glutamate ligase
VSPVTIYPVTGIPEVGEGDDVAALVAAAAPDLLDGDVVVIAHKIVSKAEGRVVASTDRLVEARREAVGVLRSTADMIIAETRHGFVCANAGVDESNVAGNHVVLLPLDPDLSARRIRARLGHLTEADAAVIISDTFGRPWRLGQTNVAIGVAGMDPFVDYRGSLDHTGKELVATRLCIADELAGAAEMVMGKASRIPAAIVRGVEANFGRGAASSIVRPLEDDLFR